MSVNKKLGSNDSVNTQPANQVTYAWFVQLLERLNIQEALLQGKSEAQIKNIINEAIASKPGVLADMEMKKLSDQDLSNVQGAGNQRFGSMVGDENDALRLTREKPGLKPFQARRILEHVLGLKAQQELEETLKQKKAYEAQIRAGMNPPAPTPFTGKGG